LFPFFPSENSLSYAFVSEIERKKLSENFWSRMTVVSNSYPQLKELSKVLEDENKEDEVDMSSLYTM
jgi:hypothetical protein